MKLFIDTNIWLRFFIRDLEEHYFIANKVFTLNDEGKIKLATSTIVISEFVFTQTTFYKINRKDIQDDITAILSVKNLLIIDKTNIHKTINYYSHKNSKWADCLIASQVPENYKLCSFDTGLEKIIGKNRFVSPEKVTL